MPETVCLLLAAGSSLRMGENKLFINIGGKSVIVRSLETLESAGCFDRIVIACRKEDMESINIEAAGVLKIPFSLVEGGRERQFSVKNALDTVTGSGMVAVHDAARCFTDPQVIRKCVDTARETGAAAAGVRTKDTIKTIKNGNITGTLDREMLVNIQTPQVFKTDILKRAHKQAEADGFIGTDECVIVERLGVPVSFVEAGYGNIKITTQEDVLFGKAIAGENIRTGIGYDAHRLEPGLPLIIGGVIIPFEKGLLGHSDADVLLHAIIDAMLGAAAMGDIGAHFPGTEEFKGMSSIILLKRTKAIVEAKGCRILNIDATVVIEKPRLAPHINGIREKIAAALSIDIDAVSVKAKTTEGMGFEGSGEGASATAVVTIAG